MTVSSKEILTDLKDELVDSALIDGLSFRDLVFKLSLCSLAVDAQVPADIEMVIEMSHTRNLRSPVFIGIFKK